MYATILYGFGIILLELTWTDVVFSRTTVVSFLCRNKSSRNGLKIYGDFLWTKRDPQSTGAGPEESRGVHKPGGSALPPGHALRVCGPLGHLLDLFPTPKILMNIETSQNKPRSKVPPPQASLDTKKQSGARSVTLLEGEIINGGHLNHPGGLPNEEGVVHPRG